MQPVSVNHFCCLIDVTLVSKMAGMIPDTSVPVFCLFVFLQGCYDALETYLKYTGVVIGSCAIVVGIFLVSWSAFLLHTTLVVRSVRAEVHKFIFYASVYYLVSGGEGGGNP